MLNRLKNKAKKNKGGVILVTILFIVAIAVIFITCAMLMTINTRKRLFVTAEKSQTRLTLESCAEALYRAIYFQDIKDGIAWDFDTEGNIVVDSVNTGIWNMALANTGVSLSNYSSPNSYMVLQGSDGRTIPGMGAESATDNRTIAIPFVVNADQFIVGLIIQTTIDDYSESAYLELTLSRPEVIIMPDSYVVEVEGGGQLSDVVVGYNTSTGGRYNADDNWLLSRDAADTATGSTDIYSTYITTGSFAPASGSSFYSDVILWGENAFVNLPSMSGSGFAMRGGANTGLYFINNDACFNTSGGPCNTYTANTGSNSIFYNNGTNYNLDSVFADSSKIGNSTNSHVYSLGSGSISTTWFTVESTLPEEMNTNFTTYSNSSFVTDPTYASWEDVSSNAALSDSALSAGTPLDISSVASGTVLGAGTYKITGSMSGDKVITCDLSLGNYYFYCPNGLSINSGSFIEVINGQKLLDTGDRCSNRLYIIIGAGQQLEIKSDSQAGIVDVDCLAMTDADGNLTESYDEVSERLTAYAAFNSSTYEFPVQTVRPAVVVYGCGGSTTEPHMPQVMLNGNHGSTLTAYIRLYPSTDTSDNRGSFHFYNADGKHYYGRPLAYSIYCISGRGSGLRIPYCPSDGGGTATPPDHTYTWFYITDYRVFVG